MSRIRIVIPCRDEGRFLRATIDSILATTRYEPYEILVSAAGAARTDLSFLDGPAYAERASVRFDPEATSAGRALNDAARAPWAAYCVFLEARCLLLQPEWLQLMVETFETHPGASMVQPEVVQCSDEGELRAGALDHRQGAPAYASVWTWPYRAPSELAQVIDHPGCHGTYEAMAGTGTCTFVRTDDFLRLGGFDAKIAGLRAVTMDYCVRAWLLGAPTIVDPRIQVHLRGAIDGPAGALPDSVHAVLRTAYKYLSPRRRDIAEGCFRAHDLLELVEQTRARLGEEGWLRERVAHERARVHDDDWLFDKFLVHEVRHARRD
jgi:GT2 family glycosyltransferase